MAPDGDGHLFWECTFPPLVEIRENPEFHDLMRMDKGHCPRCLLWHGLLPVFSGVNGASPWSASASESAGYPLAVKLRLDVTRLVLLLNGVLLIMSLLRELVSLLISMAISGVTGVGVMLMLFALRVIFRLVEVSARFLDLFSLFKGLRCGVSFWLCSPLVLFTWVLRILVSFVM